MKYICKRCTTEFSEKGSLIKHLKRKNICHPVNDEHNISIDILLSELSKKIQEIHYDCKYCGKEFSQSSNKYRHEKICKQDESNVQQSMNNSQNTIVHNNSGIINNVHQPITININALGSYLNEDLIKNIFLQRFDGLLEAFRQKHLNDLIPENNNLRKPIHKDNLIDGEKWNIRTLETALNDCFKNMGFEIIEFLKDNRDINFNELTKEKQNSILNSFMHYIGKPLNWNLIAETDIMTNYHDIYNHMDPTDESKKRKTIYKLASENIYQFTKSNMKCAKYKECPF